MLGGGTAPAADGAGARDPKSLRAERERRNAALIERGFNFTNGFDVAAGRHPLEIEVLVPPAAEPHEISVWAVSAGGDLTIRIADARDATLASWSGPSGERRWALHLPAGRNRVTIDARDGAIGLLGLKGPVASTCAVDATRVTTHTANAAAEFRWPYLLLLPREARANALLVAPNNTGFATTDADLIVASGKCTVAQNATLADRLGAPLLVPLFPRPAATGEADNLYLHALSRASLTEQRLEYARVDLQLIAMIDDARAQLEERSLHIDPRVLLTGFSASASFASRFAMLHPERVLAVAATSPGGWPIAPAARDDRDVLAYPVGIADVASLIGNAPDAADRRKVSWFFLLGDRDSNDSVPSRDSFAAADTALITRRYGTTPAARWKFAERLYRSQQLRARFALYPGIAHELSPQMCADIEAFFRAALDGAHER